MSRRRADSPLRSLTSDGSRTTPRWLTAGGAFACAVAGFPFPSMEKNMTAKKFRVPVAALSEFLLILDPGDFAMIEYRNGPDGEHYVVELSFADVDVGCDRDNELGIVPIV